MNYMEFRNGLFEAGCFGIHQVRMMFPGFQGNNLTRWVRKGLLVKLRQGYYAFPEYLSRRDFSFYVSNRIYRPSYISLHTALAFYGMIPEAVTQITAVSTLKTADFENDFGFYRYKTIRENLFWGYDLKPFDSKTILFATPEKALLDLLYLYPFYASPEDFLDLRLDEEFMQEELNADRLREYAARFNIKALDKRIDTMLKVYGV